MLGWLCLQTSISFLELFSNDVEDLVTRLMDMQYMRI